MTSAPYDPQDRLPGERPAQAAGGMPVIGGDGSLAHQAPTGAHGGAVAPVAGTTHSLVPVSGSATDRTMVAFFGDVRKEGYWTLAERTNTITLFGDVLLDLRDATFETSEVRLIATLVFGDLKVIVPPGLDVDVRGLVVFGDRKVNRRTPPLPGSPRLILDVRGAFGDTKVVELAAGEPIPSWRDLFRRRG